MNNRQNLQQYQQKKKRKKSAIWTWKVIDKCQMKEKKLGTGEYWQENQLGMSKFWVRHVKRWMKAAWTKRSYIHTYTDKCKS